MLGLGAVGFFVSLGPVSNLVPIGVVRADRLLYMPSFYACLLMAGVADGAGRWLKDRAPGLAQIFWPSLAALALGMFALRSQANVRAWTDPVALWSSSLQRFPDDPAFQVLLGEALLSTRRPQEALVYLERAAQHPEAPRRAWARLAAAHLELGNLGEVEQTLERAVSDDLAELLLRARYRLLSAMAATDSQARERHLRLGEAAARRAVALQPAHYDLLRVWGNLLGRMPGRANDAEQAFARACALNPDPWYALFDRSRTRLDRGDALRALDDLRAVLASLDARADPALSALRLEVVYDLADAALRVGQTGEAKSALARLRREAPNYRAEQVRSLLERVE
jgi:tetratricopeptide (TPR) repeat protein